MDHSDARIVIAERWSVLRRGLVGVLQNPYTVVADTDDETTLVRLVEDRPVDLAVIGDAADLDALRLLEQLLPTSAGLSVVVLCEDIDADRLRGVLQAGAHAVLSKKVHDDELVDGVRRILSGDRVIDQMFLPLLFSDADAEAATGRNAAELLSARELSVLKELARGKSNRQIAASLLVGESTVKTHLSRIYAKLGVDGRHRAVGRAAELGVLN